MTYSPDFKQERAKRYFNAMRRYGHSRDSELSSLELEKSGLNPSKIIDLGAGEGYLTSYLAGTFPEAIIYAFDQSPSMLKKIKRRPNTIVKSGRLDELLSGEETIDLVVSLASFHHISDKKYVIKGIGRLLKRGGHLVIADVADETPAQVFFDDIVRKYSITSHDFDFLDSEWARYIAKKAGLKLIDQKIKDTPWRFKGISEMTAFIKDLFGLDIPERLLEKKMPSYFQISEDKGNIILPWKLGYFTLKK